MPNKKALNDWFRERGLPTYEELQEKVKLKEGEQVKGAVVVNDGKRTGFAPHQISALKGAGGKEYRENRLVRTIPAKDQLPTPPPPARRTEAERVSSLMLKLVEQYKKGGDLGLSEELLTEILGAVKFAGGRADLTTEDLRRLAAHFLGLGEIENKKAEAAAATKEVDRKLREGSADA